MFINQIKCFLGFFKFEPVSYQTICFYFSFTKHLNQGMVDPDSIPGPAFSRLTAVIYSQN